MVRQARAMVRAGAIGSIRQLHLQYVQGYLASEDVPPGWRLDPERVGGSMILIDIGTHAHHLGAYVTGLDLDSLCADVGHVVPGRKVDDYVSMLLRYSNGARGSMWVTNAASGAEHGLNFRIFGETGGLEWHQEEPNRLAHRKLNGFEEIITRRPDSLVSEDARRITRVQIGHPEGYIEAFANLYSDFARTLAARMRHQPADQIRPTFPDRRRRRQRPGFRPSRDAKFCLPGMESCRDAIDLAPFAHTERAPAFQIGTARLPIASKKDSADLRPRKAGCIQLTDLQGFCPRSVRIRQDLCNRQPRTDGHERRSHAKSRETT